MSPVAPPSPAPPWLMRPWAAIPVYVVEDRGDDFVAYIPPDAELGFVDGDWPTADGRHPWHGRSRWEGHGALMVHHAGDPFAVWHFWTGPTREFHCWYINLQAPFVRTRAGFDTQDFELDLVVFPDGSWIFKDSEVLDQRVIEGRFTHEHVEWIRALGDRLGAELEAGRRWWDPAWALWAPSETWCGSQLPANWHRSL